MPSRLYDEIYGLIQWIYKAYTQDINVVCYFQEVIGYFLYKKKNL